jgi:glutamine synthetase
MTQVYGMLTATTLAEKVASGEIETVVMGFTDHFGRLLGKRFEAEYFIDEIISQGTHACNYLLTVDMDMEPVPGYAAANWERGYGDFHLLPAMATLRVASWLEKTALVLCDVQDDKTHSPVAVAPRSVLRKQLDRAAALGFQAKAASEIEYYVYEDS